MQMSQSEFESYCEFWGLAPGWAVDRPSGVNRGHLLARDTMQFVGSWYEISPNRTVRLIIMWQSTFQAGHIWAGLTRSFRRYALRMIRITSPGRSLR